LNVLFITDKVGRIQYNRAKILKSIIKDHQIDVITLKDKRVDWKKYDLIYYSHFSLYKKIPAPKDKTILTSVTSHKCLSDFKKTLKALSRFDRVSVNNTILFDRFKDYIKNLYYTPNGVDTSIFVPDYNDFNDDLVFGWVGNTDRATKRYNEIVIPLSKKYTFKIIGTSKKDGIDKLLNKQEMRDYYHGLDYFIVSSNTEGTPNPALEAMSCGIPVITTKVGNMIEIVDHGASGFFVEGNVKSFVDMIDKLKDMSKSDYHKMCIESRSRIESWDWSIKYRNWNSFIIGENI
jgi:glycosyltransferase involved in cell wall biosynthesis